MSLTDALHNSSFIIDLGVLAAACAVFALVTWKERKPRDSLDPSLIPTIPVMLGAGIVGLISLTIALNFLGIHTGR